MVMSSTGGVGADTRVGGFAAGAGVVVGTDAPLCDDGFAAGAEAGGFAGAAEAGFVGDGVGGLTRDAGFPGPGVNGTSDIVAPSCSGGGVGRTGGLGFSALGGFTEVAGGVSGTSEIVAPSSGPKGTVLSPFAGTPTPCGPPPLTRSPAPFFDFGSSIGNHSPHGLAQDSFLPVSLPHGSLSISIPCRKRSLSRICAHF